MKQLYEVSLMNADINKIQAIVLVREFKGLGLAEAKHIVDTSLPVTLASNLTLEQAKALMKRMNDVKVVGTIVDMNTGVRLDEADLKRTNDMTKTLKCPKCGCGFIEHLMTDEQGEKGFVEMLRRKFGKRYECSNCGYTWK